MRKSFYLILLGLVVSAAACNKDNAKTKLSDMEDAQGVKGQVIWLEGNLMPSYGGGAEAKETKGKPVEREIWFCKPLNTSEVTGEGSIFKGIESHLVKKTSSNEEGQFSIQLPAGRYSVFTKEEGGFFANSFDGEGNINVVLVEKDKMTTFNIDVNYKAVY